jgi:hypothetical protein
VAKASFAILVGFGFAFASVACSPKLDHPGYVLPPPPPEDASTDADALAEIDTGPPDTGSVEGTKPDAPAVEVAPPPPGSLTPSCQPLDPAKMTLAGALDGAGCSDVLATPGAPRTTCFALPCFFDSSAQIRPSDGALLYTYSDAGLTQVRQFIPDELPIDTVSKLYSYPKNAEANDPVVSKHCDSVANFALDPKTGALFLTCQSTGVYQVLDEAGKQLFPDDYLIVGVGNDGSKLVRPFGLDLEIADAAGVRKPVVGLPPCDPDTLYRPRAKPTGGFWVIARFGSFPQTHERWSIAADGTATKDGVFQGYPADAGDEFSHHLDANGDLWSVATISGNTSQKRVFHHSLTPGTATVVYDDSMQPTSSWTSTGDLRVRVGFGYLVTGP